jgi:hypothetical protein
MNWFLWAAVAAAAAGIVLFTALWIDVSRGTHTDDRRGAAGATLLAWCVGVATVLGIIGLVVNVLVTPYAKEHSTEAPKKAAKD